MQTVTSAWVLIVLGLVVILAAMLVVGPDYRWTAVLGLAVGAVLVVVGLRRRRRAVAPPGH